MTLRLIRRSAEVLFDAADVYRWSPRQRNRCRKRTVGFVFQKYCRVPYLSVLDNILLPYHLAPVLRLDADARARAHELAGALGIDHLLARRPHRLSQGERQRAVGARTDLQVQRRPLGGLGAHGVDHDQIATGQLVAHLEQTVQKSSTVRSSPGGLGARGSSVVTTPIRTRGPSRGVISRPIRPISPRPASRATSGVSRPDSSASAQSNRNSSSSKSMPCGPKPHILPGYTIS